MTKVAFSLSLLPLVVLLNNLVSGKIDAGGGLEIPPEQPHPRIHKDPGRSWESWMSPEGTLWYPGRRDYRMRESQKGNGAGAAPSRSDTYDTSTRRYFSLEEGPQFLSEHRVANSAHSQYGQGGVDGGVANSAHGQYGQGGVEGGVANSAYGQYGQGGVEGGVANSAHAQYGHGGVDEGVANSAHAQYGQGGVDEGVANSARGQYGQRGVDGGVANSPRGQYGQGEVDGGIRRGGSDPVWYPYEGQYGPDEESPSPGASNGQYPVDRRDQYGSYSNGKYAGNVPYGEYFLNGERVPDAGDPKPNGDYVPDHMRGQYIPGQAGQGGQYVPDENGQLIPGTADRYIPGNGDHRRIDYGALPDPSVGQNGHFLPENDPRNYYNNGHEDYYPEYPYYYDEGVDYGPVGVEGDENGVYVQPGHPYDPNPLYENGHQPEGEIDSHIPAGRDDKHSPDEDAGRPVHQPSPGSNRMIYAGRDFLPVPTAQNNHTSGGQRGLPDSLTRHGTEEAPNLVHTGARIDGSRPARNQSSGEDVAVRREHGRHIVDRRIPVATRTARPMPRRPITTTRQPTTTATTTTTAPPTTTTVPPTTTTMATTSTPATTTQTIATTRTTTTRPTVRTTTPYPYNPRPNRPAHYPTREHHRGQGTNSHTDARAGTRPGFDEVFYPRLQRPTIPTVEIDLSKLMPEETMHRPEDSGRRVDSYRPPQTPEQRPTQSPSGTAHTEGSETHGIDSPQRRGHYTGGHQPYPHREQEPGRQHSSQTGSTGSGIVSYGRQPQIHDKIRPRPLPTHHEDEDQSSEQRTGGDDRSPPYLPETRYEHGAHTDQWSGSRHQPTPERRRHGSYQPIDENGSYDYAAGRDRTHSQGKPEVDGRRRPAINTETRRQTFDASVDSTDEGDYSGEDRPGISQRGACPSVSQCRCCRWNTQQTRKSMECLQPKFKMVEVQICIEEFNGVCVRTGKRKTLKPNGTEVRMCSKVQLKRSCFVCCPTFYPRGHNQTCNGILDGIDKKGLRITVEADIGGFYQPPRVPKSTTHTQDRRHENPRDQAPQHGRHAMNGHAAYRAPASIRAESEQRMMADQTANARRICVVQKMGANGQTITERRPCPSKGEVSTATAEEVNVTTAACCLSREHLHNLFLRYCCDTKRYNGREYSQRMCCGTKETPTRQNGGRVEPLSTKAPNVDMRQPQLTNGRRTDRRRTVVESAPLRASSPDMDSESQIPTGTRVSRMREESEDANLETQFPEESESQPIDTTAETEKTVDTVRRRKCCPPGTRLRSISNGEEAIETQESPGNSRHTNSRSKSGYVLWSRVYSCCANGNYLRKVACCLQRSEVSKLCCTKVSRLRS